MSPAMIQGIANLVNFLLFAGVLIYFAGPAVKKIVKDRHEATLAAIREAEAAHREAEEALKATQTRLGNIEQEFAQLLEQARTMAAAQGATIEAEAREDAERVKAQAKGEIERERQAAVQEIRQMVMAQAFDRAALELQQQMNPEQQRQLVGSIIQKVGDGSLPLK